MPSGLPCLLLLRFVWIGSPLPDDVGYEDLFKNALDEVENANLELSGEPLPGWLDGVFYMTGPANWNWIGPVRSPSALTGFGKVHKWEFHEGRVSFSTKFPSKHFGFNVNTWLMGERLAILTDMMAMAEVDKDTLEFVDNVAFTNVSGLAIGGSAHPHCMDDGSYLGLRQVVMGVKSHLGQARFAVYKLHPERPGVVQDIATLDVPAVSYAHSFGLTKNMVGGDYSVIVAQPIFINKPLDFGKGNTTVHFLPMDGGRSGQQQTSIELDKFYFGHFVNAFSPAAGRVVFDLERESHVYFTRYNLAVELSKAKRDAWAEEHQDAYSTFTRYEVDLEAGTVSQRNVFADAKTQCAPESKRCELNFYALHPDDYGRPYCGFWAQQSFFNSSSFGSWGIVRADLCHPDGPKVVASWYQRNAYPGEPQFVPRPNSADKTQGVIIFKTYEGDTGLSKLIVADARTLRTLTTAVLPVRVPFTVHGKYYPREALATGRCVGSTRLGTNSLFM